MTDPRWMDMVGAYVLDALEPEERSGFEARLAQDDELQREVRLQREVVAGLPGALPRVTAPASLKDRVLSAARSAPPITSARSAREPRPSETGPEARQTPGPAPRRSSTLPWFAAAAALVVAVALGVMVQRMDDLQQNMEAELAAAESTLQTVQGTLAERDSLLAIFLGPDVRTASLSATGQPPSARIFWNTATSTMLVAAFDLPPAPDGRTYQLWGIPDGQNPVSLGTFQTGPNGTAVLRRQAPEGFDFQIGAVSEEPTGGSDQPTSTPILVGSWSAAQ